MKMHPTWYTALIANFKNNGFFESESNDEIANRILRESKTSYFGDILDREKEELLEPLLSSYDKSRVWFIKDYMVLGSLEEFERNLYPSVFQRLKSISFGRFSPENVELHKFGFHPRGESVEIQFDLHGSSHRIPFYADLDVLAFSYFDEINALIEGFSFQTVRDARFGPCFILFLSDAQKAWILKDLGWTFWGTNTR